MTKNLATLSKQIEKQETKSKPNASKSVGVFLQSLHNQKETKDIVPKEPAPLPRKPVNPLDELKWGQDTFFLGDSVFSMMMQVEEIKKKFEMMKELNFRHKIKDKATVGTLYDRSKKQVLIAVPPCRTVVLSIGSQDLCGSDLKTLKEYSKAEVRKRNEPKLKEKARHIKAMIQKLNNMDRNVIYIVPATSVQRQEVFEQFEEILTDVVDDLPYPAFKMLNLPELIRSTSYQFDFKEEHLKAWYGEDLQKSVLSDFGCLRLLDAIKRTIWSKNKKSIGKNLNPNEVRVIGPDEPAIPCPRCTRLHSGGPDSCRSKSMTCRKCGQVGHFYLVHDETDTEFQKVIVQTLGIDIYNNPTNNGVPDHEQPPHPIVPTENLNDWYQTNSEFNY